MKCVPKLTENQWFAITDQHDIFPIGDCGNQEAADEVAADALMNEDIALVVNGDIMEEWARISSWALADCEPPLDGKAPYCRHCGSDEVEFDAFARWDNNQQKLTLSNDFPTYVCSGDVCGGEECSIIWIYNDGTLADRM